MKEKEISAQNPVDLILQQSITAKASDIHLEPERGHLVSRLRIDGILYPLNGVQDFNADEIISRIKVLAQMNIVEKRIPQDGHLEFNFHDKVYNFRVSTTPTIYGEAVVMRLLNREAIPTNLSDLGFTASQVELVNKLISSPYGIVLITGPMGSGKTTLLYSFLNHLNSPERNILTLEDPVEFQMPNIRQMQINESIGWSFAKGMRAVVRQDPDVIMVGEIRDDETAAMAIQAALTGRLVFSTFHTFDVPGIIIRLTEMGIPRSVIAHSLVGVITTRLVRKNCQSCTTKYTPKNEDFKNLGIAPGPYTFRKGGGCEACQSTGFSGRIGVFEITPIDADIKANVVEDAPQVTLQELLNKKNTAPLRQNGVQLVLDGVTTPDEIIRVLGY